MVVVLVLLMIASCVHDTVQTAKPLIQHYFQHGNSCSKIVCTSFSENIFAAVLQRFITRFVVNMKNQYQTKGSRDFELLYGDNKIIFFEILWRLERFSKISKIAWIITELDDNLIVIDCIEQQVDQAFYILLWMS